MEEIRIKTPLSQGRIRIGKGCVKELVTLVKGQKNFLLTDENVYALYTDFFKEYFSGCATYLLPVGEEQKSLENLCAILSEMTKAGLHRTSRLFAVGGGVIGDIGGLASATYMRGISCVQIPTTLLSQIDSSVGGKTAVNHLGVKNVIGAFYQPSEVLVDCSFLSTLPARELKCGLGEVVKYALLNEEIYRFLQANIEKLKCFDERCLEELIPLCIRHKSSVVERDEKESGERKSLNLGHTTAHAIELKYGLSHGESVLYGMALETQIAIETGVCDRAYGADVLSMIKTALAFEPVSKVDLSSVEEWAKYAKSDKKNTDDGLLKLVVAKAKSEWAVVALSFEEYIDGLKKAIEKL